MNALSVADYAFRVSRQERELQGRLHLHVARLADGEVQVLQRLGQLVRVAVQEQLARLESGEGHLGTEKNLARRLERLVAVGPRLVGLVQ